MTLVRTAPTDIIRSGRETAEIETAFEAPSELPAVIETAAVIESASANGSSTFLWLREFLRLQGPTATRGPVARFFGADPLRKRAERAYAGALAELEVADAIAALGDEWIVLDGAGVGGRELRDAGDRAICVERILVGPPGVFTVSLRNHSDDRIWVGERTFVVGSARFPHIPDAEFEADRVADAMSVALDAPVTVTPCVVVADPAELAVRDRPRRTSVLIPQEFGIWLHGLPRILSVAALADYCATARAMWPEREPLATEEGIAFLAIHESILRARTRRLFWSVLAAVVVTGAVLVTTTGLVAARQFGY